MWSISEIKNQGKTALKKNYWRSVLAALLLYILAGGAAATSSSYGKEAASSEGVSAIDPMALAIILTVLIGIIFTVWIVSLILKIFVFNPLQVGCYSFFKRNNFEEDVTLSALKDGFGSYGHVFVTLFLRDLFLCLWTLLFIIPGIIKSYSYRMVPYIIKDNPELSATEVIKKSREMMDGHKWHTFVYDLSFIGWIILSIITGGIVQLFWFGPYKANSDAALYLELSK